MTITHLDLTYPLGRSKEACTPCSTRHCCASICQTTTIYSLGAWRRKSPTSVSLTPSGRSGRATLCEVKWMSGDTTWLPYGQVEHLTALIRYLQLLEVDGVHELPRGSRAPPQDNDQMNCGACSVECTTPGSSRTTRHCGHDSAPWRRRANYRNILRSGEGFILRVNERYRCTLLVPRDLLRQYLAFSIRIRSGSSPCLHPRRAWSFNGP